MEEIVKMSNGQGLREYFQKVLELQQSGVPYPVNLNVIWPLVYSEKGKAVRSLLKDFISEVDYEVVAQNGKNLSGGRPEDVYLISVPCMEYFIARKVREVFEVYREVFHAAVKHQRIPQTFAEALQLAADQALQLEEKDKQLVEQQKAIEVAQPKVEFYEAVTGSSDTVDIGTVAKVLNFSNIGRTKLFEILRNEKILMRDNKPFQQYVDRGWFRVVESSWSKPDGSSHINFKTVVFQKGIDGIRKILNEKHT